MLTKAGRTAIIESACHRRPVIVEPTYAVRDSVNATSAQWVVCRGRTSIMIRILASCCLIAFLSVSQGVCQDQADAKNPAEAKQITAQIRKVNLEFRAEDQKLFKKFQ